MGVGSIAWIVGNEKKMTQMLDSARPLLQEKGMDLKARVTSSSIRGKFVLEDIVLGYKKENDVEVKLRAPQLAVDLSVWTFLMTRKVLVKEIVLKMESVSVTKYPSPALVLADKAGPLVLPSFGQEIEVEHLDLEVKKIQLAMGEDSYYLDNFHTKTSLYYDDRNDLQFKNNFNLEVKFQENSLKAEGRIDFPHYTALVTAVTEKIPLSKATVELEGRLFEEKIKATYNVKYPPSYQAKGVVHVEDFDLSKVTGDLSLFAEEVEELRADFSLLEKEKMQANFVMKGEHYRSFLGKQNNLELIPYVESGHITYEKKADKGVFNVSFSAQEREGGFSVGGKVFDATKKKVRVEGNIDFNHLNLRFGDFHLVDFTGRIPFEEEIKREEKTFAYLIEDNPFKRTDYARWSPLLKEKHLFSLRELRYKKKKIGNLSGRIFLRQNQLLMDTLTGSFCQGDLESQLALNLNPEKIKMSSLLRWTNINPSCFLEKKEDRGEVISFRSGMDFQVDRSLLEGRIDFTEIGSKQLLLLFDLLDEKHADADMNKIRSALSLTGPRYVGVNMQQGGMSLRVILENGLPLELKNFPLTPFIQAQLKKIMR